MQYPSDDESARVRDLAARTTSTYRCFCADRLGLIRSRHARRILSRHSGHRRRTLQSIVPLSVLCQPCSQDPNLLRIRSQRTFSRWPEVDSLGACWSGHGQSWSSSAPPRHRARVMSSVLRLHRLANLRPQPPEHDMLTGRPDRVSVPSVRFVPSNRQQRPYPEYMHACMPLQSSFLADLRLAVPHSRQSSGSDFSAIQS